jgi:hypothetical protein
MAANRDWFPKSRTGQLVMARDWQSVAGTKTAAWSIPAAVLTELGALITATNTALTTARNETTRTPVATAQCKVTGSATDPANKGFRIWYTVVAPGETPPANLDDLRKSFYAKRKKDVIEFDFGDSGKTAYFSMQIENEGRKSPWEPLVQALIP